MKKYIIIFLIIFFSCQDKEETVLDRDCTTKRFVAEAVLNDKVETAFIIDVNASETVVPLHTFKTLQEMGTIRDVEIFPYKIVRLSNGVEIIVQRFRLRSLKLGEYMFNNMEVTILPTHDGSIILGKDVLSVMQNFKFDYKRNIIVLE